MSMLWAVLSAALAATPCPDFASALERAEAAIAAGDTESAVENQISAERALSCGPIVTSDRVRARFMMVVAVRLDDQGDRLGADNALFAAWSAWPGVPTEILPAGMRQRFLDRSHAEMGPGAFRLFPIPDRKATLYVDGTPTTIERLLDNPEGDPLMKTTAGLHIVQLAPNIDADMAIAGRLMDLDDISRLGVQPLQFNIFEQALIGGRSSMKIPSGVETSGPSGGCAGKR
jgi:hypothetical protein